MGQGEGNGADVEGGAGGGTGGGGTGEKKFTKFAFSMAKPSNRRPPLPPKGKEKELVVVEYVTSVDAEVGILVSNPRAGSGVRVVPKQENSWRPEKRMKNIMMESDATKPTEETFEMETIDAGPKANVQYGLTLMERVEKEGGEAGEEAPVLARHMSLKELEDQKLREDLTNLPEEATLDQYEELPVEEFGEALLRGMGWEKGKPIGRNSKSVITPLEYVRRQEKLGLGAVAAPPKATNRKYIKPGETREKNREYMKPKDSRDQRREDFIKPEESRENGREEYRKSRDYRDSRREEEFRENGREEYRKSRDYRDNRREVESRESRRDEYSKSRDSRESRRDEHLEPRDSREKRREEISKRDESRESRREEKRSDRRRR